MSNHAPINHFKSENWFDKALIISIYYNGDNKRTVRETASRFNVSIGMVSESLLIARNVDLIKSCKTRKEALELIYENFR